MPDSPMPEPRLSTGKSFPGLPGKHVKNGVKYDKAVTAMMVEDMLFNPILATKVLLNLEVPPHEELRILVMWTKHFTLDDSGFSTGKSFTYAIVAALRSILMPGRIGGILSGTFRQGQLVFRNFDHWYERSKIFRHCIKMDRGRPRLNHGQAAWEAFFRGGSTVRVLPPNFLQDAERLRSERWHDGYFDEWTTFGNFKAFTSTIIGRVTAVNNHPNCPVRQNHLHLSSTPNFTHHPSYKIVKKIQANIDAGNKDYARMTFNYRHIPKTRKWERLVNRKVIFSMQTMNPKGVVVTDVDGLWSIDSQSYYSSALVEDPKLYGPIYITLKRLHRDDIYYCAFDMARGHGGTKQDGGDDFSMVALRKPEGKGRLQFCFCMRRNNVTAEQAAAMVQEFHQSFQFSYIMYDPGGGGLFVRDELLKPELTIRGKLTPVTPIIEMGDTTGTIGDLILIPFRRSTYHIDQIWGKMKSDSVLVNRMHQNMRNVLEMGGIVFPNRWNGWENLGVSTNRRELEQMRQALNQNAGLNDLERTHAEIDLAIRQLIAVDVERNEAGDPIVRGGMYTFKSKEKKDSAYSLIYAAVLDKVHERLGESEFGGSGESDTYCAASEIIVE